MTTNTAETSAKTALITGGNGFLGSHLAKMLAARGYHVRVFALEGTEVEHVAPHCEAIHFGDICKPETLSPALDGVDVVFHLAAVVTDWGPSWLFEKVNVEGTQNLLQASIAAGCRRFVHMSTLAVHRYRDIQNADETLPCDAISPDYATTKRRAEEAVLAAKDQLEVVVIRPGLFPYGPGDVNNITQIFEAIERGKFGYIGGGHATFCTSHAENLAEGLCLAAEHPDAAGEVFVLCDDQPVSWREFGDMAASGLGVKPPRISAPGWLMYAIAALMEGIWRLFRIRKAPLLTRYRINVARYHLVFSNAKARRILGYAPRIDFREGLAQTIAWYQEEHNTQHK